MKSILKRAVGLVVIIVGAFFVLVGFGQENPTLISKYGAIAIGGGIIGLGAKLAKKPDPQDSTRATN